MPNDSLEWNAARYHQVSAPQFDWGQQVIARLQPRSGERILDLGCGTGRLTAEIRGAVDGGCVVGLDRSAAMLAVARASADAGRATPYVRADAAALPFAPVFDAVFSTATLHWVPDHDAVFSNVFQVLRPGGRFVAQCGGAANLDRLLVRAAALMRSPEYVRFYPGWQDPWHFADRATTTRRLSAAGFTGVRTSIEPAPVRFGEASSFAEFVSIVCIRHHLERLPLERREAFVGELTTLHGDDDPPYTLDYQRLNIMAWKPA